MVRPPEAAQRGYDAHGAVEPLRLGVPLVALRCQRLPAQVPSTRGGGGGGGAQVVATGFDVGSGGAGAAAAAALAHVPRLRRVPGLHALAQGSDALRRPGLAAATDAAPQRFPAARPQGRPLPRDSRHAGALRTGAPTRALLHASSGLDFREIENLFWPAKCRKVRRRQNLIVFCRALRRFPLKLPARDKY